MDKEGMEEKATAKVKKNVKLKKDKGEERE